MSLKWTDSEDVGIALSEKMPDVNPLTGRFTDLHTWVCVLEAFEEDPHAANEKKLEEIQVAWVEEWEEGREA